MVIPAPSIIFSREKARIRKTAGSVGFLQDFHLLDFI